MPVGRSDYEERKENKINSLLERSEKSSKEATQQGKRAMSQLEGIVPGQPILVGHHSEGKHRRAIAKHDAAMHRSLNAGEKAASLQRRAEAAANNNSISSDNPEAVNLYTEKLKKLEALQEQMKAANLYWRKNKTMKGFPGLSDVNAAMIDEKMKTAYPWIQKNGPHASWELSNNSAEIRRIKQKLETLSKLDNMAAEIIKFNGGEMRVSIDINRVQFIFDGKPSEEIRKFLKANGFRWAPSEGAWQRQRTENAVIIAKKMIPRLEKA